MLFYKADRRECSVQNGWRFGLCIALQGMRRNSPSHYEKQRAQDQAAVSCPEGVLPAKEEHMALSVGASREML